MWQLQDRARKAGFAVTTEVVMRDNPAYKDLAAKWGSKQPTIVIDDITPMPAFADDKTRDAILLKLGIPLLVPVQHHVAKPSPKTVKAKPDIGSSDPKK